MIIREHIEFERGLDPKKSMRIGRLTFDDLEEGSIIRSKKGFSITRNGDISSYKPKFGKGEDFTIMWVTDRTDNMDITFRDKKGERYTATANRNNSFHGNPKWEDYFDVVQRSELKESLDFERGKDPKDAMKIGISSFWDKLKKGDVLQAKKQVNITGYGEIAYRWGPSYNVVFPGWYIKIEIMKEQDKEVSFYYQTASSLSKILNQDFGINPIRATLKKLQNNFDLIQPSEYHLHENLEFERGQDPKATMGLGVKEKIRQGILGLLNSSRDRSSHISTINLLKNREDLWLEIADYGTKDFEDFFDSFLSPEYFKNMFVKAKPRKYKASWKQDWKVFIKDEYKDFFKACFTPEGFIIESVSFERGMEPMDKMSIGRVEERKQKLIDRILQEDPHKWTGSSVMVKFLVFGRAPGVGWDGDLLQEASFEDLLKAVGHIEMWNRIDKKVKVFDGPASTVQEAIDFERGQDPKKAMGIGWGDMLMRDIQEDEEDGGYTFMLNKDEIRKLVRKNIPSISDNEMDRFMAFSLQEIIDKISNIDFRKKDYKNITRFIKSEIESQSRWWMDLNSDKAMRQGMRNSGMNI